MILILIILLIIFAIICTLYIIINIKTKNFELHDIKINGGNMNEVDILTNEAIEYNKKIISKLDKVVDLNKIFSKDNINIEYEDKIYDLINSHNIWPFVIIQIKNGKAEIMKNDISFCRNEKCDNSLMHGNNDLINNAMKMYGPIKDTYVLIWVSDREAYEFLNNKFPILVNCVSDIKHQLIMPDITFDSISFKKKYGKEQTYNWDETKKLINNYKPKEHINKIYFKGTNTGQKRHKLREYFNKFQKDSKLLIKLDAWDEYEPMYMWKKYDALLNLPGHYDWSNRFKYLFLMDKLIINVNPILNDDGYIFDRSKTFIDFYVKPNVHYYDVNVKCKYIKMEGAEKYNKTACIKAIKEIDNIDLKKYKGMINKGKKIVQQLELKHVYKYIHATISEMANTFTYILPDE
jgi:hypothetical protein